MDPKPLPDRIRPLEGAGLTIMALDIGAAERRRWRWAGPVFVLCCIAFAALVVLS